MILTSPEGRLWRRCCATGPAKRIIIASVISQLRTRLLRQGGMNLVWRLLLPRPLLRGPAQQLRQERWSEGGGGGGGGGGGSGVARVRGPVQHLRILSHLFPALFSLLSLVRILPQLQLDPACVTKAFLSKLTMLRSVASLRFLMLLLRIDQLGQGHAGHPWGGGRVDCVLRRPLHLWWWCWRRRLVSVNRSTELWRPTGGPLLLLLQYLLVWQASPLWRR